MPTDEQFLRQIHTQPEDDLPRLIYADWLEEQGNPRAEFIRGQIAEARLRSADFPTWRDYQRRFAELRNRCDELRRKHETEWLTTPLCSLQKKIPGLHLEYKRGFPERVCLGLHQPILLTPLIGVGLLETSVPLGEHFLVDVASLARLDQLTLRQVSVHPTHLESLAELPTLQHLTLDHTTDTDARLIPLLTRLPRLKSLRLFDTRIPIRRLEELSDLLPGTVVAISQMENGGQRTNIQCVGWNWLKCPERHRVEDRCSVELPAEWVARPDHSAPGRYALQHPIYAAIRAERFGRVLPDLRLQLQLGELRRGTSVNDVLQVEFQPGEYESPQPGVPVMIPDCTADVTATSVRPARRIYPSEITERVLAAVWCRDREFVLLRGVTEDRDYARWEPLFHAVARSFRWE